MAGSNADFNAAEFRAGIQFAYEMAAAPISEEGVVFHFPSQLVFNVDSVDEAGVPFDPDATVVQTTPTPVRVACGVEYVNAAGQSVRIGEIAPSHVAITLLDEDYAKVAGCAYVVVGGDRYDYEHTDPPSGLFDVGLYTLRFRSRGER